MQTILALEDNTFALGVVNTVLSRAGYTVLTAASESAAMSSAKKHKGPFQLFIADASVCLGSEQEREDHLGSSSQR